MAQPSDDLSGQILGNKYRIVRLVGRGAFGSVYEAIDEMVGASRAVKVLNSTAAAEEGALQSFLGEAKLLTKLDHENIVRWVTFDKTPEGLHYFVMEFLRGEELSRLLARKGRLPVPQVMQILLQTLAALKAAHAESLLHLDLKPQNIYVLAGEDVQIKVIDFGISQHVGAAARTAVGIATREVKGPPNTKEDLTVTMATLRSAGEHGGKDGLVLRARGGTPLYASPEQCRHLRGDEDIERLDGRSDLYSLGVIAFELLAGRTPWPVDTYRQAFRAHIESPLPSFASIGARVPRALDRFVQRCLAKDREQRFADVNEAYAALHAIANPKQPVFTILSAALAVLLATVWLAWPAAAAPVAELRGSEGGLWFGPQRPALDVGVDNLMPELRQGQILLVEDPATPTPVLGGWRASFDATKSLVHLEAPTGIDKPIHQRAFLQFANGKQVQFSQAVQLEFLPSAAWTIGAATVRGANGRIVDPVGAELEVVIDTGGAPCIESVQISCGESACKAQLDASRSGGNTQTFVLPLTNIESIPRDAAKPIDLAVSVLDKANNHVEPRRIHLEVDGSPLAMQPQLLECPLGVRPIVYPEAHPLLRLGNNRRVTPTITAKDDKGRPVEVSSVAEGGDWRLTFPPNSSSYEGTLVVDANENEWVHHQQTAQGTRRIELPFTYETTKPEIDVSCKGQPVGSEPLVVHEPELTLLLHRNAVETTMQVICVAASGGERQQQEVKLHRDREGTATMTLATDGEYSISLLGYRHILGAATNRDSAPEINRPITVVRDTQAPSLRVVTKPTYPANPSTIDAALLRLDVRDERSAPVTLSWRWSGGGNTAGSLPLEPAAQGEKNLSWQELGIPSTTPDGVYRLAFSATDAAGNVAELLPVDLTIARAGPTLRLEVPESVDEQAVNWFNNGDKFTVRVDAKDANGVAGVQCGLQIEGMAPQPLFELQRKSSDERDAKWEAGFRLQSSWSGKRLKIRWSGKDRFNNVSPEQTIEKVLPQFVAEIPVTVWSLPAGDGSTCEPMRLVRGSANYVFGGRDTAAEKRAFAAAKVEGTPRRFLTTPCSIADFYLDEHEVTVAEYLVFLRSPAGYLSQQHWIDGQPDAKRCTELLTTLAIQNPRLPATGLGYYECEAYARWAGKRLPTDREFEYAVRGGTTFRVVSWQGAAFVPAQIPIKPTTTSPWSVDLGDDQVATGTGAGLRGLCSNVAEWTHSDAGSGLHFAAGGNIANTQYHFSIMAPLPATAHEPWVGFRCAMDIDPVRSSLQQTSDSHLLDHPPTPASKPEK